MGDRSKIEWTDATWGPVVGCERVSAGCTNCYAERLAATRLSKVPAYEGLAFQYGSEARWSGVVRELPERLEQPLRWTRPRNIFVCSMSDLFHVDVSEAFLVEVFAVMAAAPRHTFQVLTKRPKRALALLRSDRFLADVLDAAEADYQATELDWPLPNVWVGTSIENSESLWRARVLRHTPAAVRFLSLEPLLGPLDQLDLTGIGWVIAGGESGPRARPMHPSWPRQARDLCAELDVPFHFKQWGEWAPWDPHDLEGLPRGAGMVDVLPDGTVGPALFTTVPGKVTMARLGKSAAGRLLDGRTHDDLPERRTDA